jgi:hypothetical protein
MATVADASERRDALVGRLFMDAVGAFDLFSVYIGERLGLYRALADKGPLTSTELAEATGIHERYAREWLEHQAASDLLTTEQEGGSWRFRLPEGHDEALLDVSSLNHIAPLARAVVASIRPIDAVLEAMRSGGGVPYADYGEDLHESQAAFTRPLYENLLGKEWLGAVPEIHERLLADPPARVADVACGQGRSSMEIARAYPKVQVDGIDSDHASIARAREHLAGSDVEDRVTFDERTPPTRAWPAATTWSRSSRPCMTCRTRSRSSAQREASWPTEASSSSATSAPRTSSRHRRARSSASTTGSASSTASRSAWSAKTPREPAR